MDAASLREIEWAHPISTAKYNRLELPDQGEELEVEKEGR
jgi:hypothetical protein